VLWPAREGFYVNESKDHRLAAERFVQAVDAMLAYDKASASWGNEAQ